MKSLSLNQPHVIVMVGVPGSGKSFFAEKFAETFHAPFISRDHMMPIVNNVATCDALVVVQLKEFLKTHHTLIIEGPATTRSERADIARLARRAGYEALFVWVQTDPATAKLRSMRPGKESTYRPLTSDEYDARAKRFNPPHATEKVVVISGKHTYATQVRAVLKKLAGPRAAISSHTQPPLRPAPQQPDEHTPPTPPQTPPTPPEPRRNIMIQ